MPTPMSDWRSRGYIPHFNKPGLVQSIAFRLFDAVPEHLVEQWKAELGWIKYLPSSDRRTVWAIVWEVAREPMFLMLVACGLLYLLTGDRRTPCRFKITAHGFFPDSSFCILALTGDHLLFMIEP